MNFGRWLGLAVAVASGTAAWGSAVGSDAPAAEDDQRTQALSVAEDLGRAIYRHDRAAALGTDEARKDRGIRRDKRVRGWITEARGAEVVVTFIDETPAALYRVRVPDEPGAAATLEKLAEPAVLSPYEAGASAARAVAAVVSAEVERCSRTYNTVVLPVDGNAGHWQVYLLPGTTRNDVVPLGGTHRIETDGEKVLAQRAFTRSCIALPRGRGGGALMITHLLDPMPTEVHVHWSLWAGMPMYVATQEGLWKIEGGAISRLKDDGDEDDGDGDAVEEPAESG